MSGNKGNALRKIPLLGMCVPLLGMLGCGTTYVGIDADCPARPELEPIPVELQLEIAPHTLSIIADNQLRLKKHIKDLEALSACRTGP